MLSDIGWKGLEHSTEKAGPGSESAGVQSDQTVHCHHKSSGEAKLGAGSVTACQGQHRVDRPRGWVRRPGLEKRPPAGRK